MTASDRCHAPVTAATLGVVLTGPIGGGLTPSILDDAIGARIDAARAEGADPDEIYAEEMEAVR